MISRPSSALIKVDFPDLIVPSTKVRCVAASPSGLPAGANTSLYSGHCLKKLAMASAPRAAACSMNPLSRQKPYASEPLRGTASQKETNVLLCLEGPGSALLARCLSLGDGKAPAADYWPAPCRGHPLLPALNTPFPDLLSLEAALVRQWNNEALRATAEARTLLVAEGLGAVAVLARRLDPTASPRSSAHCSWPCWTARPARGRGFSLAKRRAWRRGAGGEPRLCRCAAPPPLLNAGKLTPSELWEEAQTHCRPAPRPYPYRPVRLRRRWHLSTLPVAMRSPRRGKKGGSPFPGTA